MEYFETCWTNIRKHSGETFHTITGLKFTYTLKDDRFIPSRTEYFIAKSDFRKAFNLLPLKGPGEISKMVRGSSYVWAVLNDERIC